MRPRSSAEQTRIFTLLGSAAIGALFMLKIGWWRAGLFQLGAAVVLGLILLFQGPVGDPVGKEIQKSGARVGGMR